MELLYVLHGTSLSKSIFSNLSLYRLPLQNTKRNGTILVGLEGI